ncbi:MAG: hypothetical protein NZ957_06275 [Thaumarchaeota archaeon]|nr:hypothetical protein [Candidatus Calditenuaceae archaeon]MDW8042566.1 hypothetical protein [Nitrososphaerota archaeon]
MRTKSVKRLGMVWTVEAILASVIVVLGVVLFYQIVSMKTVSVSEYRNDLEELANKMVATLTERGQMEALVCREDGIPVDEALAIVASAAPPGVSVNFTVVKLVRESNGNVVIGHRLFSVVWGAYDPTRSFSAWTARLTCSSDRVGILAVSRG